MPVIAAGLFTNGGSAHSVTRAINEDENIEGIIVNGAELKD